MNPIIFPTVNDVGGNGKGKVLTESNIVKLLQGMNVGNWVMTLGLTLPTSSANLSFVIPQFEAMISGYHVDTGADTSVTCTASQTNYVYLQLTRDGSGNVNGATFVVNTTGVAPADCMLIGTADAGASSITTITNLAQKYPLKSYCLININTTQTYTANVNSILKYSAKIKDLKDEFDTATSKFTAKDPGLYVFAFTGFTNHSQVIRTQLFFYKNGSEGYRVFDDTSGSSQMWLFNGFILVPMNAGDTMEVQIIPSVNYAVTSGGSFFAAQL